MLGQRIIVTSWVTVAIFAVVAIPDAIGLRALDTAAVIVAVVFFLGSLPIWVFAYFAALARTTRGDNITVSGLFFLTDSAPKPVQRQLLGALGASIVLAAATAFANPFGVLVPMLPLGFAGLWGARHGVYPPRPTRPAPVKKTGGRR